MLAPVTSLQFDQNVNFLQNLMFHKAMNAPIQRTRPLRAGFTLLEILIVIGLVGTLMAVLIGGLMNQGEGANRQIADIFVNQTSQSPLMAFRLNMNRYPSTDEGLDALVTAPSGASGRWAGPYLEAENLIDPWGNPYQYRYGPGTKNSGRPDIWSNGPDGQSGTSDDITNWDSGS